MEPVWRNAKRVINTSRVVTAAVPCQTVTSFPGSLSPIVSGAVKATPAKVAVATLNVLPEIGVPEKTVEPLIAETNCIPTDSPAAAVAEISALTEMVLEPLTVNKPDALLKVIRLPDETEEASVTRV